MRGRGRFILIIVAALALGLAGGAALAGAQSSDSRQSARGVFKDERPGKATGVTLSIDYVNPDDPNAKPFAVEKVVTKLARGARIDTSAPQLCEASDAELMAQGAAACPPGSRVGGGEVDLDTGNPGPNRIIENDATLLNNAGELIFITESTNTPTQVRAVTRARVAGRKTINMVPPIPGTPPPDSFTALTRIQLLLESVSRGRGADRRNYITTPRSCPDDGAWTNQARFVYRDGVEQVVKGDSPCREKRRGSGSGSNGSDGDRRSVNLVRE